jgi:retinol dehydrogenase 12
VFEALKTDKYIQDDRYNTSKLLDVMLTRELARRLDSLENNPIIVNSINPGLCKSELFRHAKFPLNMVIRIGSFLLARSTEMGSRTLVAGAVAGKESHGKYMDSCKVHTPSPYVESEEGNRMQAKLFTELMAVLDGIEPGVSKNVLSQ